MKNPTQLFYQIMKYPEPTKEVKLFLKRWSDDFKDVIEEKFQHTAEQCDIFSWDTPADERMKAYIEQIQKHARVWKSLPFVTHIYLANSITFNALHEDSDIDLFIITTQGRLRIARFMSRLILFFLGLARNWNKIQKKYCLSFYVEKKHENLYELLLQPLDIYLIFRIAHLVPLYTTSVKDVDLIWKSNKRLKSYLPNHPGKQLIRLGNDLIVWSNWRKETIERILKRRLGNLLNLFIGYLRSPWLHIKKGRLGKKGWWIVINDYMLKFHGDKRKDIILRYMNVIKSKKNMEECTESNIE